MAAVPPNLTAFPDSPYATELQRGFPRLRFTPPLEAEYIRHHLVQSRPIIRVVVVFGLLLLALRGVEVLVTGGASFARLAALALVLASTVLLTWLVFSRRYETLYLPMSNVLVPLRNAVIAGFMAQAATTGQPEMLMVVPMLLIGPFFFLGLRFRAALLCGVLTTGAFIVSATVSGMAAPVAMRVDAILLLVLVSAGVSAWYLERWSRMAFLESSLIGELAEHDTLTGMKNRRVLDEQLTRLWQQSISDGRTMAILLIDVDHFKAYNDLYGHQAGDRILRLVAQTVRQHAPGPLDVVARYGGEEFAVLLYDVEADEAKAAAERIRRAVEALQIEHEGSRAKAGLTISIGVAVIEPTEKRDPKGAFQLADQALYEAKVKGRNRVHLMNEAEYRQLVTGVFSREVGMPFEAARP